MNLSNEIPASLVEHQDERGLPPGGGLMVAVALSLAFWAGLAWLLL